MRETAVPVERAFLLGLDTSGSGGGRGRRVGGPQGPASKAPPRGAGLDAKDSLDELGALVEAAGGRVVGRTIQRRRSADARTWMGKGKVQEVGALAKQLRADLLVTDDELAPSQQRALEEDLGIRVVDRSSVILDIFAKHARTKEGRLQVEVAQLEYMRPRLRGLWTHLERLGGGVGTRGPGESQLESDRRVLDRRLADLKERLRVVEGQRARSRRSRSHDGLFLAALVGYTNAGKSTLMNALSGADVLVADQPFATLDPTTRRTTLPIGTVVLLSDTVGFVNKLPPTLVAAFRATLEELSDADLLVHVVDVSHPDLHERMAVVRQTLGDLGLGDRPTLVVMNKTDALRGPEGDALRRALASEFSAAVFVSAREGIGLDELGERLAAVAGQGWKHVSVRLPYSAGGLLRRIREHGDLKRADYGEAGIEVEAEVPAAVATELERAALS